MNSAALNEIGKALAVAQSQTKGALKSGDNPHFRSHYSELSDIWDACREALAKNGLSVIQFPELVGEKQVLTTMILHHSGQWISGQYELAPEKRTPQGYGSALTYARRYCLAAMVGIASKDDDGEAAMERNPLPRHAPKPPPPSLKPALKTMQGAVTPDSSLLELADYIVPIGEKHRGKRLGDIAYEDINSFVGWLEKRSDLSDAQREFMLIALSYLDKARDNELLEGVV